MLKIMKIWSAVFAITILSLKTMSEITRDHPITHAIDTYLLGLWLISGLLFARAAPMLLLSGWAIATGFFYGSLADNLTQPEGLKFIKVFFVIVLMLSFSSLLISNHIFTAFQGDAPEQRNSLRVKSIRYGAILLGSILILAPLFELRADYNSVLFISPYYFIAIGLFVTSYLYHTYPKLLLIVFGLALGFFGDEFYRFVRYDEPEAHVLIFTIAAIVFLLLGVFLVFRNIELQKKTLGRQSGG